MAKISKVEKAKLRAIMQNPVSWAHAFITIYNNATKKMEPWTARWYQKEMLMDNSLRKVYRCGRRCLPGWAKVFDPTTGELASVENLYKRGSASVATMQEDFTISKKGNCPVFENGVRKVYRLTLENGAYVDATDNHPFYTKSGWVDLGKLKKNVKIASPATLSFFGDHEISKEKIDLIVLALLYSTIENNKVYINKELTNKELKQLQENIKAYNCEVIKLNKSSYVIEKSIGKDNDLVENKLITKLRTYNLEFLGSTDRKIPLVVFNLKKELVLYFLEKILNDINKVKFTHKSQTLIMEIYHLLLRFGVLSRVTLKDNQYTIENIAKKEYIKYIDEDKPEIAWFKVKSIEYIDKVMTYDLTVPQTHNFIVNDIISHNTGKSETMIVEVLHKAFTNRNFRILYVAPYETQINLAFVRMQEIISTSPLIKNEVTVMKNSPHTIGFKNGSLILGFTTGASTGSGAASIRGQRAD